MTTRINIGPVHPSTHGVLHLSVDVDGDTIKNLDAHVGFLHRGVEKLVETRMYMQSPPYMEKLDYVAPLAYDEAYVATVEEALGIQVKERAMYIRVIELELQRIASHLFFLGALCNDMGQMFTTFMWGFEDRDKVLYLLEQATGQRMFYVNMRLGGVTMDLPPGFAEECAKLLTYLSGKLTKYEHFLERNPIFKERMKGVGVLSIDDAKMLGVTGPALRASGIDYDVRSAKPYYVYEKLRFRPQVQSAGDNFARYRIRILEMRESIRLILEALRTMPEGDALGMPIRLIGPNAKNRTVTVSRELPRGECLMYMVADPQRPYRLAIRSPCFVNLSALQHLAKDQRLADLFSIMGTLDLVMACVDR